MIKNSFSKVFKGVKKHPGMFVLLFFTQLLFLIIISAIFVNFAISIGSQSQEIMESLQTGPGLNAMPDISAAAGSLVTNIFLAILFFYLAYIIVNGLNWFISKKIIGKKVKIDYILKFGAIFLVFTIPALILMNIVSKIFISASSANTFLTVSGVILVVLIYFMYIGLGLVNGSIKSSLQKCFKLGIKKFGWIILSYFIMDILFFVPLYLIYYTMEGSFALLIGSIVLFVMGINTGRLFWLVIVDSLN